MLPSSLFSLIIWTMTATPNSKFPVRHALSRFPGRNKKTVFPLPFFRETRIFIYGSVRKFTATLFLLLFLVLALIITVQSTGNRDAFRNEKKAFFCFRFFFRWYVGKRWKVVPKSGEKRECGKFFPMMIHQERKSQKEPQLSLYIDHSLLFPSPQKI